MNFSQRNQIFFHFFDFFFQSHETCIEIVKNTKQQCRCTVVFKSRNTTKQILLIMVVDVIIVQNVKKSMKIVANMLLCKRYYQNQSVNFNIL